MKRLLLCALVCLMQAGAAMAMEIETKAKQYTYAENSTKSLVTTGKFKPTEDKYLPIMVLTVNSGTPKKIFIDTTDFNKTVLTKNQSSQQVITVNMKNDQQTTEQVKLSFATEKQYLDLQKLINAALRTNEIMQTKPFTKKTQEPTVYKFGKIGTMNIKSVAGNYLKISATKDAESAQAEKIEIDTSDFDNIKLQETFENKKKSCFIRINMKDQHIIKLTFNSKKDYEYLKELVDKQKKMVQDNLDTRTPEFKQTSDQINKWLWRGFCATALALGVFALYKAKLFKFPFAR